MDTDLPLYKVSLEPAAAHISFWQVLLITVKKLQWDCLDGVAMCCLN